MKQMSEEQGKLNYLRMVRVKLVEDLPLLSTERITSPQSALETALEMITKEVGSFDREVLFVLNLNSKNQPLNASMVSMGTLTQSSAHPREILKASILSNADRMILFHNHPSGDTYPSPADIEVTKRMQIAGNLVGIDVLDHLIVNQAGEFTSLRSEGLLLENIPTQLDLEAMVAPEREIQEVKEETFIKENTTPDNLENRVSIPSLENHYTIEEPKEIYSRKTTEEKEAELEEFSEQSLLKLTEERLSTIDLSEYRYFIEDEVLWNEVVEQLPYSRNYKESPIQFVDSTADNCIGYVSFKGFDEVLLEEVLAYFEERGIDSLEERLTIIQQWEEEIELLGNRVSELIRQAERRLEQKALEKEYMSEQLTRIKQKTTEEKKAELEELSKQIQTKVNEFSANPETMKDFLLFKRQFPTYSMNNTFLIYQQNPQALGIGAFGYWKKQGYSVKRGEKGISIYAPIVHEMIVNREGKFVTNTKNATPEDLHLVQLGQYTKRTTVAGFQKKTVFDITQTTAPLEKYPKIVRDMYELNHLEQYRVQNMAINRFLEKNGIQLIDYDKAGVGRSTLGYFIPAEKEIYLQEDLTPIARFKTAVHETAHGILHSQGSTLSKAEEEYQAQFTMLVVADTLGIPMKEEDYGYIKSYQNSLSDEKRRELLEGVLKTAEMVLETYEETLTQVQSQTLTPEEAKEAERLQLNIPSLSVTDIQEIIHYPATDKQKYLLVSKLVENNFGEMSQEEKYQLVEDQANFIKTKVKDGHRYYQLGILNEAELSQIEEDQLELHIVSMTGAETTQIFEDEEQVAELLLKKEALPIPDSAVAYTKNVVQKQQERERQLERTNRQEREQQL